MAFFQGPRSVEISEQLTNRQPKSTTNAGDGGESAIFSALLDVAKLRSMHAEHLSEPFLAVAQTLSSVSNGFAEAL